MFETETLFILGAGASVPYGYPLGWELVEKIIVDIGDEILLPVLSCELPNPRDEKYTSELTLKNFADDFTEIAAINDPSEPLRVDKSYDNNVPYIWGSKNLVTPKYRYRAVKIVDFLEFRKLKEALQTFNPISIDTFLRDNPSHALAGKIMIVYSLLKSEDRKKFEMAQSKEEREEQDNWYRYLLNDMSSCSADDPEFLLQNKVSFITFNYDLSLDFYLLLRTVNK